ncbi:MAG: very short patch repair endonuclease [Candidatus Cloacimonadota bacterium]|nr:MAG: very short patch repair endonuclease [Candidatus Cloacimonadota bacterium]
MDKLTKEQRSLNMKAVKSKGSKIEKILAKEMWARGLRYRKNVKDIFGKPDFAFKKAKTAVFCDSEFWHGKDWETRKNDIKSNRDYWFKKIERNIERDKEVTEYLTAQGWTVLRFWGKEITKNTEKCVQKIQNALDKNKALKQRDIDKN